MNQNTVKLPAVKISTLADSLSAYAAVPVEESLEALKAQHGVNPASPDPAAAALEFLNSSNREPS
ncbi:hypothetical protein [Verrucomicrobium sp. BvORR034]|uniref:hypothetical protein n=1 Tax=Verrucomicrobium sp. BvORR034 TaxID=1396418 RepID=UPI000678DD9D|nr:hypothetical protein [Verrucomicrobium sp. BvORR034]